MQELYEQIAVASPIKIDYLLHAAVGAGFFYILRRRRLAMTYTAAIALAKELYDYIDYNGLDPADFAYTVAGAALVKIYAEIKSRPTVDY